MFPLILPKQDVPVLDGKTFSDTWYLFLQVLQAYGSTAGGIVRYGDSSDREAEPVDMLLDGTLWFETDTGLVYQWRAPSLEWTCVDGVEIVDKTLTANASFTAPTSGAPELVYFLLQDGTGGRTITWNSGYSGYENITDAQALQAGTLSTFRFRLRPSTGLYVMTSMTLGMTP